MGKKQAVLLATVIALGAGTAAFATNHANDAIEELAQAKITLTQAIAAAEQHSGGRATQAELEREKGKIVFEVEVVKGNQVSLIHVDPADGKVLGVRADADDRKGEHEDSEDK